MLCQTVIKIQIICQGQVITFTKITTIYVDALQKFKICNSINIKH